MLNPEFESAIRQDPQTVTPSGQKVQPLIDGLIIRHCPPLEDHRGELIEVFNPDWAFDDAPLVYAYQVVLRPRSVRAWVVHKHQEDRMFTSAGVMRWAFFDARMDSSTQGQLNVMTISERNRTLIRIPRGVFHGVQNVGTGDAIMFNLPTVPYNHANPDKYRLPVKNDLIPFDFNLP